MIRFSHFSRTILVKVFNRRETMRLASSHLYLATSLSQPITALVVWGGRLLLVSLLLDLTSPTVYYFRRGESVRPRPSSSKQHRTL